MQKDQILALKRSFELNQISLFDAFELACEEAYRVRFIPVPLSSQRRIRADGLAFPFTAMLLDLDQLIFVMQNL